MIKILIDLERYFGSRCSWELACALLAFPPYLSKRGIDPSALSAEVSRIWAKVHR